MAKSIAELLNNKKSRDRILAQAKAEAGGGGLLGLIPAYGPDGQPLDSSKDFALGGVPKPEEVDCSKTSEDWIIEGRAILKDGQKRRWK